MKAVFAFQATSEAPNAVAGSNHGEIARHSLAWIRHMLGLQDEDGELRPDRSGAFRDGLSGASVEVEHRRGEDVEVLSIQFAAGAGSNNAGFEQGELTVYSEGLVSNITLRLLSSQGDAPAGTLAYKPALIDQLAGTVGLAVGGVPVNKVAGSVEVRNAAATAAQLLTSKRSYPVVAISTRPDGATAVKPATLAADLAGLAVTLHVRNSPAADRIATDLGPSLAVKDGAVRVYWPGLTRDASPYLHKSYAADDKASPESERSLREAIYANVCRVLAQRIGPDKRVTEALRSIPEAVEDEPAPDERAADYELAPAFSSDKASAAEDVTVAVIRQEYEARIADLEILLESSTAQIEALQRERFNLAEAHRVASQMDRFSLDSLHQFELITDALAVDSLAALVQLYEQHVPDRAIIFLPEAHESARNSPYSGNLLGPAHLLRAVCEVATRYHFGNLKEGEDFKRAFEAAGETSFAADSSPTTLSKYGSKYERSYNDGARTQTVLLRPHVSFGSGRANSSVKIYWHVDEANRRFVVGQIGEHLPIAKRF